MSDTETSTARLDGRAVFLIEDGSITTLLEETDRDGRALFLGNGFSQSFDKSIFEYRHLLDRAKLGKDEDAIREAFKKLRTADFELTIRALDRTSHIGSLFLDSDAAAPFRRRLSSARSTIKSALWQAISSLHPANAHDVDDAMYDITRKSLDQFSTVFTVNYDLLLYWALTRDAWYRQWKSCDGFGAVGGRLLWRKSSAANQNVFWLHGGLHLLGLEEGATEKLRYRDFDPMMDQIRVRFKNNEFPLLVAEGRAKKKLARISRSPYLLYCLERFRERKGALVVYEIGRAHV